MKLRYQSSLIPAQEGAAKVWSISCSSNGGKTAIAGNDRSIILLDESGQQKDKFATKPIDTKLGKKSYLIKCITFSPDSSRIAVGQTDNVIYVYKIGHTWNEKKVIVNKLVQPAAVSCLDWPFDDKLLIGLMDGKVRVALPKANKCSSLYKTDQTVVSLSTNPKKTSFVSGHQDGSIIIYNFSSKSQSKICHLQMAPYCLVFTAHGLIAATTDRRVYSYTENGVVQQQFDYSDEKEKEFSSIVTDPSGQNVVVASYDRLRFFSWSTRRGAWDEGAPLDIKNLYTCTALAWKADGSTVYCGTLCGGVISIDCCLRRGILKSRFETTYVAPSHVIIRDVTTESRTNIISARGLPIDNLKMMGNDRFVIGYTSSSIILADISTGKASEIEWQSGGNEKFYWDFANVCVIVNAGELTIIEYGIDGALGWVRTELTSPHLISIRINERVRKGMPIVKKVAYLVDPTTIAIVNLVNSQQESIITHTSPIDWLELNESATKLLFRDKRSRLTLLDSSDDKRTNLLSFCSYVQWVPLSDVIVAQSGDVLHVWYDADLPELVTRVAIKGEVEAVLRDAERTEVIVQESNSKVAYELDNTQIEFGTALEDLHFDRAVSFLESNASGPDSHSMWRRVADLAVEHHQLTVAQRCYAAIHDAPKAFLLHETVELAAAAAKEIGGDGTQSYRVRANLAKLVRRYKDAEKIYLEQNCVEEAIQMYQSLHKWEDALELAKATNYVGYEQLKANNYRFLFDSGQDGKAAELKAKEGDATSAVQLYLKARQPVAALHLALSDSSLSSDEQLMLTIAASLVKSQIYDKAGDLFEKMKDFDKALECYRNGKAFAKAVQLARFAFPEKVVLLESEWGDDLVSEGHHEAAINHYLEANESIKAVESAMKAKEWSKAVQIVDVIQDETASKTYYGQIADHYASVSQLDRAERLFIEADLHTQAIHMYVKNNKWAEAYRLSEELLGKEETVRTYERKAAELEEIGRLADAEQLYIAIGMPRQAIHMYRAANRNDDVIRLVEKYHSEHLQDTYKQLGMDHEARGDLKAAEEEFLKAGEWKAAINMYRENEMWSDAYRIAKAEGGDTAPKQVGYLWAKSLGGEAAVKLLNKFGMLSDAIDFACENGAFDFAFELSTLGAKERLPQVHSRMAVQMEEEGRWDEAAKHYVEAGRAEEAVAMYIHDQDWAAAERIAQEHAPQTLVEVYKGEAKRALEEGDHARAESYLLRANKPDIILRYFTDQGMWPDALRIAKEYLPHQLAHIQEELDRAELESGARGVESFMAQAKHWESQGEWARAVNSYLKVTPDVTSNAEFLKTSINKVADLTIKFIIGTDQQLVEDVIRRLESVDEEKAAEVLLASGQTQRAIMAYCQARQWSKAKQVAEEYLPEMIPDIEGAYKESLKNEGRLGELIDVDVISAIDLMVERGQWEKALDTAKQQKHGPLLDKYIAAYVTEVLPQGDTIKLLKVFEKYGASSNPANFNMYKAILDEAISRPPSSAADEFELLYPIRDLFLNVYLTLQKENSPSQQIFERYVTALHLITIQDALEDQHSPEVSKLRLKQSLATLRYSDLLPADRIFCQAGQAARDFGGNYENLAFLLLNHYLDLVDAIEEGNAELVDYSAFDGTDIPSEIILPQKQWLELSQHEEIKEWVLSVSVDDHIQKELILDRRGMFEASLIDTDGTMWPQCVISGYPILGQKVEVGDLVAEREALNTLLVLNKTSNSEMLINVQQFISKWANSSLAMAL